MMSLSIPWDSLSCIFISYITFIKKGEKLQAMDI